MLKWEEVRWVFDKGFPSLMREEEGLEDGR
jgi:hypothetical protein